MAARSFAEALRRAGRDINREKLVIALESLGDWDAGGMKLGYSARRRNGLDYVDLAIISRGKFNR